MLKNHPLLVFAVLLFINIIGYIDRSMLLGFSPQITRDLALSNTQFGLLTGAVWVVSYGVMAVVCGALADRHSRTRLISVGMLIWSICTAASGFAEDFGHMVVARIFVASGEAALVPAGTALLADLFDERRRSTVNGLFFTGIPLGIGLSYLLSGTMGSSLGWRNSFIALGVVGVVMAVALWFVKDDARASEASSGAVDLKHSSPGQHARAVLRLLGERRELVFAIAGFVCVHFAVASNYFVQLWLVRDLGADPATIARQIGLLQIVFGCLGAGLGGVASDWIVRNTRFNAALFPIVALLFCLPLMVTSRFSGVGQGTLYAGLAASFMLPFAIYGSSFSIFQKSAPSTLRSTIIGITMMSLNIVTMALGSFFAGWLSDRLASNGNATPLTWVMLVFDGLTALASFGYIGAARALKRSQLVMCAVSA